MNLKRTALLASAAIIAMTATAYAQATRQYTPVTTEMLTKPAAEEWLSWRGNLALHGYSPLNQINKDNIKDLELAWAYPMPDVGQQETAPLIHDGIMFFSTNNAIVNALDEPSRRQNQQFFRGLTAAQTDTLLDLLDRVRYPDEKP